MPARQAALGAWRWSKAFYQGEPKDARHPAVRFAGSRGVASLAASCQPRGGATSCACQVPIPGGLATRRALVRRQALRPVGIAGDSFADRAGRRQTPARSRPVAAVPSVGSGGRGISAGRWWQRDDKPSSPHRRPQRESLRSIPPRSIREVGIRPIVPSPILRGYSGSCVRTPRPISADDHGDPEEQTQRSACLH